MSRILAIAMLLLTPTSFSSAQIVSASLDILDGSDAGAPTPEGTLVIDGFVDIGSNDTWTASGTRWETYNGATIIYHDGDPTLPGVQPVVLNTGSQNDRFVTVLSRPRDRNSDVRFDNGGAASAGTYDDGPPPATLQPTLMDVAYYSNPPATIGDPSVDGYILRVALDISAPLDGLDASNDDVILSASRLPGLLLLAGIEGNDDGTQAPGWVNATFSHPTPVGSNAYVYLVPEPNADVLVGVLVVLGLSALRGNTRRG